MNAASLLDVDEWPIKAEIERMDWFHQSWSEINECCNLMDWFVAVWWINSELKKFNSEWIQTNQTIHQMAFIISVCFGNLRSSIQLNAAQFSIPSQKWIKWNWRQFQLMNLLNGMELISCISWLTANLLL